MSRIRIPIYFDYASTLCYIAWRIVGELEDELGFEALWKGVAIAERAGIDRSKFRAALDSGAMAARIAGHKREADEFSALGFPTFILGDFPMIGIQPIESMRLLLARFLRQR